MPNQEVVQTEEIFVRATGTDGYTYIVVPLVWTLPVVEKYHKQFKKFKIFSDDMPNVEKEFERFVLSSGALWFEVINEDKDEAVGVVFVSDFVARRDEPGFLSAKYHEPGYSSASYHVSMWDSLFSSRLPVQRAFVRAIFARFRLHRLEAAIPLFAGGAIRVAKKAGFVEEGTMRRARRYRGEWFDVLRLSILEDEVKDG